MTTTRRSPLPLPDPNPNPSPNPNPNPNPSPKRTQATDATFTTQLVQIHTGNSLFARPRGLSESEGFVLHHFAGEVCYSSAGFMHANTEKLSPELEVLPTCRTPTQTSPAPSLSTLPSERPHLNLQPGGRLRPARLRRAALARRGPTPAGLRRLAQHSPARGCGGEGCGGHGAW